MIWAEMLVLASEFNDDGSTDIVMITKRKENNTYTNVDVLAGKSQVQNIPSNGLRCHCSTLPRILTLQ